MAAGKWVPMPIFLFVFLTLFITPSTPVTFRDFIRTYLRRCRTLSSSSELLEFPGFEDDFSSSSTSQFPTIVFSALPRPQTPSRASDPPGSEENSAASCLSKKSLYPDSNGSFFVGDFSVDALKIGCEHENEGFDRAKLPFATIVRNPTLALPSEKADSSLTIAHGENSLFQVGESAAKPKVDPIPLGGPSITAVSLFKPDDLKIQDLIDATRQGLHHEPKLSAEGTAGTYFMPNAAGTEYVAVFKPTDEEPWALNNPRIGPPPEEEEEARVGLKKGTRVGEGAVRESAVYLLDRGGFAGVLPTVHVSCLHEGFNHPKGVCEKEGSLQMFSKNDGSCEDRGNAQFSVSNVHKIAVLDLRFANTDRHEGNILAKQLSADEFALTPIDHGYCMPYTFEDCTFCWLYWPQSSVPFSVETLEYIESLDAEVDINMLRSHGWDPPPQCADILRVSTMFLNKCAKKGLTACAIGEMMSRAYNDDIEEESESVIEMIVKEARDRTEAAFLEVVSSIMDHRLDLMRLQ